MPQGFSKSMTVVCLSTPLVLVLLLASSTNQVSAADESSRQEKLARSLATRGIETDQKGLVAYLESIHPTEEQRARAERLITQLGAEDFAERESATQELFRMPSLPTELLRSAADSEDPEVAYRAQTLLKEGKREFEATLSNVFQYIEISETPGLLPEILSALDLIQAERTVQLAQESFVRSATKDDLPLLLENSSNTDDGIRHTAVRALAKVDAQGQADKLFEIANRENESSEIRLSALQGLANLGKRETLKPLIEFLADEDVVVRGQASYILRQLTGETFRYAAYDKEERRTASIEQWQEWLAEKGDSAELVFPLTDRRLSKTNLFGTTLMALGYRNKTVEVDSEGNEILSITTPGAWMAERLANGNTLVAEYNANQLAEYNQAGEQIWKLSMPSILSARPIANGNVLVTQHAQSTVKEVNREGETIWEHKTRSSCCDALELDSGNILFAAGNEVVEITRDKEEVWKYNGNQVYGISICDNGNLLLSELNGRVVELNRASKEVVWEHKCNNPVDAIRLPNGNTLITCNDKFIEVTPENEVIWSKTGCNYGSIRR